MLIFSGAARALEFTVDTEADYIDKNVGDGICEAEIVGIYKCTLRAAIQESNALPGLDRIHIPAGTYTITQGGPTDDSGVQGDFDILDDLEIVGAATATTIIDGNNIDRVFHVPANPGQIVQATIAKLTIQRGLTNGQTNAQDGGGINNAEMLSLDDVIVARNATSWSGGGIYNSGILFANRSRVEENRAQNGGGLFAQDGETYLIGTAVARNQATFNGGALFQAGGTAQLNKVTITDNAVSQATGTGAGLYSAASLSAYDVLISGNSSGGTGGGISVGPTGVVKLTNALIAGNRAATNGGGVMVDKVNGLFVAANVTVSGNSAASGGGLFQVGGKTDATNATIVFNTASSGANVVKIDGLFNIQNSILAHPITGASCVGAIDSLGYNIDDGVSCNLQAVADRSNLDPLIATLADNDGFTQTYALQAESPAINKASNTVCPSMDQRTHYRNDDFCDIGAFEANSPASTSGTIQFDKASYAVVEGTSVVTLSVTRTGGSDGNVTVNFHTNAITARPGYDYEHTAGTLAWADGDSTPKTITVPIINDSTKEAADETFSVFLVFPLGGATLGNSLVATVTITDNDWKPGALQFSAINFPVSENAGSAQVTVERTGGTDGAVAVTYSTSDGSAKAGQDYAAVNGVLQFPVGVATATIIVPIMDDEIWEPGKYLSVTIDNPTNGASLGTSTAATVTIADNEPYKPGTFRFAKSDESISETGDQVTVTVERIEGADGPVAVEYAIFKRTASLDQDFTGGSGTLSFAHGETTKSFVVPILDDNVYEGDESVTLYLKDPPGVAAIGTPGQITIAILDTEIAKPGTLQFAQDKYVVTESTPYVDVKVDRSGGADGTVLVTYTITSDTASAPADFKETGGTLTFVMNETWDTIRIHIANDAIHETDETLVVTLSDPTNGAALGARTVSTVTIVDDDVSVASFPPQDSVGEEQTAPPAQDQSTQSSDHGGGGGTTTAVDLLWLVLVLPLAAIHRRGTNRWRRAH
jgi:hypothetical protein